MTRSGEVDEPTREWPEYKAGRADAPVPEPAAPDEPPPPPATAPGRGPFRALIALGVVVAILATLFAGAKWLLPDFDNPFAEGRTDRSQPVLLQSMRDLSRYVGADGTFQQVVDVQDNRQNVPDFLVNDRTLFVASGTVEAYVDFSKIAEGGVKVSDDGKTATITLPAPELTKAALDMQKSYVVTRETGLFNKIGDLFGADPNRQAEVYRIGEQRITEAAVASGLGQRAQDNTRKMLEGLLKSLGYTTVTVEFAQP
jgi:hypothetical protein